MLRENPTADNLVQLAHDIRSPLFALRAILNAPNPLRHQRLLLTISKRLQDLTESVWASSRPMQKKTLTKIYPAIVEVIDEKQISTSEHVFFSRCYNGATAQIEPQILQRIVSNLLDNALQACHGKAGAIFVSVERHGQANVLTVTDNGYGMSISELKNAFKSGRGLSSAKKALRKIGGTINVSSSSTGTEVSVVFY